MSVFEELKRRNVFRVGIAYLIAAWLILQVIDVVAPILELPNWISRAILLLLAVGFIVAIILAWAYELTPEGVKREDEVDRSASITPQTGRKLDFIIIGVLAIALAFFMLDKFLWSPDPATDVIASVEERTIAVLPFVNMSADEEQEYFSDGLTEELLNLLARIPELRVTSRSSAFYYKGKDFRIVDVGRELGVGHVLEGSVRRSGDTIRITAQLIDVSSDTHLWSDTWDRTFDDIFDIQDEISAAVVAELRVRLVGEVPRAAVADPEAYALYLRAGHLMADRAIGNNERARDLLNAALEIDPQFTNAWLRLGAVYVRGNGMAAFAEEDVATVAREAARRALELDPDNAGAHTLLSSIAQFLEADLATAEREITRALELSPNDAEVLRNAAFIYSRMGRIEEAQELYDRGTELDPVNVSNLYSAALGALAIGNVDDAESALLKALRLAPGGAGYNQRMAWVHLLRGDYEAAFASADKETVEGRKTSVRALIFQSMGETDQAVAEHETLIGFGERWTYEIARMYAYRDMHDEAFDWLERAFARADSSLWFVSWDPFLDNIRDDPRFEGVKERLRIDQD